MKFTWPSLYLLLFVYRCAIGVLAFSVVIRLTSLGDVGQYANAEYARAGEGTSTYVVFLFGKIIRSTMFANEYFLSIVFQSVSFVGIVMLLMSVVPDLRKRLLPFFFLPSFTIWTSIPGKETFVALFVCLALKAFVDFAQRKSLAIMYLALGLVGVAFFKPHFLAPILFLLGMSYVASGIRQRSIMVLGAFCVTISILVMLRPALEAAGPQLFLAHFTGDSARSARPPFWTEPGDFFGKAAEGMWLALVGPTLYEVNISVIHLASFVESMVVIGALGLMLLRESPRIPAFCFILGLGTIFWTLVVNYPAGVMNPGTAIRYRAGWLPIVLFCVTVLMTQRFGHMWVRNFRTKVTKPSPPAPLNSTRPA